MVHAAQRKEGLRERWDGGHAGCAPAAGKDLIVTTAKKRGSPLEFSICDLAPTVYSDRNYNNAGVPLSRVSNPLQMVSGGGEVVNQWHRINNS
jgi:hypothetical protein